MKTRFVEEVGTRAWLRVYWDGPCPNASKQGMESIHEGMLLLGDSPGLDDWDHWGKEEDYPDARWPQECIGCGIPVPTRVSRQVFTRRRYATASGSPEPGDLFFERRAEGDEGVGKYPCWAGWTNCDGNHLLCVLPSGQKWDCDSRSSNCALPQDTTHRCWVRGDPRAGPLTVGKGGNTCKAGEGSIQVEGYHAKLTDGVLVTC